MQTLLIISPTESIRRKVLYPFTSDLHLEPESLKIRKWGKPSDVKGIKFQVKAGDVIFGRRRAYQKKVAIADFDCVCSAHAMVLRAKSTEISKELFPFFPQSDQFLDRAVRISVGSLSPTINWKTLAKEEFIIPARERQSSVTELLLAVEDCLTMHEKLLQGSERLMRVIEKDLLTRGIGHATFKETEIGLVPEEWEVTRLNDVSLKIQDGTHFSPRVRSEGVAYVTSKNVTSYGLDLSNVGFISQEDHREIYKRCDVRKGDVLYVKDGVNTGNVAINTLDFEFSLLSSVAMIRPNQDRLDPQFLKWALDAPHLKAIHTSFMAGTAIRRLTLAKIRQLRIPLPPLSEQQEIAESLSSLESATKKIRESIRATKVLKMKLINQFLTEKTSG